MSYPTFTFFLVLFFQFNYSFYSTYFVIVALLNSYLSYYLLVFLSSLCTTTIHPLCITPFSPTLILPLHFFKHINSEVYRNKSSTGFLRHVSLIGRSGLESVLPTDHVWVVGLGFIIMSVCACIRAGGNSARLCVCECVRQRGRKTRAVEMRVSHHTHLVCSI